MRYNRNKTLDYTYEFEKNHEKENKVKKKYLITFFGD